MQNHLAEVNKYLNVQSKRNCACFTPDGVVYTKIKSEREFFKPKQKRFDRHRHHSHHHHHRQRARRSTNADESEIYIEHLPSEFLELLRLDRAVGTLQSELLLNQSNQLARQRVKRETKDYVMQTMDELTTLLGSIERKYANSSVEPVQCSVEMSGMVNCSNNVYESEEAWRQSRTQIDMLIKLLKNKITDLKDIKRHLKEHRPMNVTYDEEMYENFSVSLEEIDEMTTKAPKRKLNKSTTIETVSTTETSPSTTTKQQQKNRTRKPPATTTTDGIPTIVMESATTQKLLDSSTANFSSATELNFDFTSTLAAVTDLSAIIQSTAELVRTTAESIDVVAVEMTTTTSTTTVSAAESSTLTTTTGEDDKKIPAECFCEPEPNK